MNAAADTRRVAEAAGEQHEGSFIGPAQRRLFAVHRTSAAGTTARAGLLICPPFFHEQFLSYRLLSLVAARLATHGMASLRFDYFGSGDSCGEETAFSLAGACADSEIALAVLRERVGDVPLVVLGARAGVWPASVLASRHALPLWLWQPLPDGAEWLAELQAFDARERASRHRYPFQRKPAPADAERLLAAYCPPALRSEIGTVKLTDLLAPVARVAALDAAAAPRLPHAHALPALPAAATAWTEQIDLHATFMTRELGVCVDALAASLDVPAPA